MSTSYRKLGAEKANMREAILAQMHEEAKAAFPGWELKPSEFGHRFSIGAIEVEPRGDAYSWGDTVKVDLARYEWSTGLKSRHAVCKWTTFLRGKGEWRADYDALVKRQAELDAKAKATSNLVQQAEQLLRDEGLDNPQKLQVENSTRNGARLVLRITGARSAPESIDFTVLPEVRDLYEAEQAVTDFQLAISRYTEAINAIRARLAAREQAAAVKVEPAP